MDMAFKFLNRYNLSLLYLSGFIVFLILIFIKFILNIYFISLPCSLGYIFSLFFVYKILLLSAIFCFLYVAGDALRWIFCFKYVTTGIFSFFALAFFVNMILGVLGFSSAKAEVIWLYSLLAVLILIRILSLGSLVKRLWLCFFIFLSVILLLALPKEIFWGPAPVLTDVKYIWYPMNVDYFNNGFIFSLLHEPVKGYGLFIPHIFVTLKRLALLNSWSVGSYSFMPNVLFFIGILFLVEIKIKRPAKIILVTFFVLYIFVQRWVALLLCDSLMGDGLASLCFAIVLKEVLAQSEGNNYLISLRSITAFCCLWILIGVLSLSKPFISVLCYLLPLVLLRGRLKNINVKVIGKLILALILMSAGFILWVVISKKLNLSHLVAYKPQEINRFNPAVILEMLSFWVKDKYFLPLFFLLNIGLILGLNRQNRFVLLLSFAFVLLNSIFVILIYVFYGQGWEIESTYRFLVQMSYVSFFMLGLFLEALMGRLKRERQF